MSGSSFTLENALAAAESTNCTVRFPSVVEVFVDIDSDADFEVFEKHVAILMSHGLVEEASVSVSKSGLPCRHAVVRMARAVDGIERIAIQAVLGSDRLHELLSWIALEKGTTDQPSLFFEPKASSAEVF